MGRPRVASECSHCEGLTYRSILSTMKIATGKVVGGKVVIDGASLEEGASVTILARDEEKGFRLTPEEEAELLLSIAEADRGETIPAEEVLKRLARPSRLSRPCESGSLGGAGEIVLDVICVHLRSSAVALLSSWRPWRFKSCGQR